MTRCFIIGHPVAHSRSPIIHGHWLAEHGLDGSYERVDVPPDAVAAFLDRIRSGEFAGGNVTVPNKEAVLPLLDHVGGRTASSTATIPTPSASSPISTTASPAGTPALPAR